MVNISLPLPEPANDAQRAEFADILDRAAKAINRMLREQPNDLTAADLAPLIAEFERFFAGQPPSPEVLTLLARYRRR